MRTARLTYKGAYHHVMNRGIEGRDIFRENKSKEYFLKLIKEKSKKTNIKIFAYCIMNNHYHLILQNSSGRLSSFMRQLDGEYGINYRKKNGGKGPIFQDRYKSTLIQEDPYLIVVIVYVLLNPVRAGMVEDPYEYRWSSIKEYFTENDDRIVNNNYVEEILQSQERMEELLDEWLNKELPGNKTKYGYIIGDTNFKEDSIERLKKRKSNIVSVKMREDDYKFKKPSDIIRKFESEKGIKLSDIETNTHVGKRLRSELLVLLKDKAGLKYREIMRYSPFKSLKHSSLGKIYKRSKDRLGGE